ncbi:MAG: helix-turn-helix domain-containing protein [Treponema sp.]|nr:helix-turn-helix domain-containing protein [Treponema sp.]
MANINQILALNIKTLRKKWCFTQEKLAEVANLSTQSISVIEGCRTWVSDKTLEKLAKALNVEIFQLFIPQNENEEPTLHFYNRLLELRTLIKEDVDKRLDQFYISEKSIS